MTQIIAHRGVSSLAPENTLPAFQKAAELGADGVELDVHFSADGKLMVIHDEKLERTTGSAGYVAAFTAEHLRGLCADAGKPGFPDARIPFLSEVLELLRPTALSVNIELKNTIFLYPGLEEAVLSLVRDMGMQDRVYYSSFNHYSLAHIKELDPGSPTGLLYDCGIFRPWDYAKRIAGADALHPVYLALRDPDYMPRCREYGIAVRPWTVDKPEDIQKMLALGVDAIITNVPQTALPLRDARRDT